MRKQPSVPLRLASLPVLAAIVVSTLAAMTIQDLTRVDEDEVDGEAPGDSLATGDVRREHVSAGLPALSTEDALWTLVDSPNVSAIDALWPEERFQSKLYTRLFLKTTPAHLRMDLLAKFEARDPKLALDAARALAREEGLEDVQLLSAAFEVLSSHGEEADLELLTGGRREGAQLRAAREKSRAILSAKFIESVPAEEP